MSETKDPKGPISEQEVERLLRYAAPEGRRLSLEAHADHPSSNDLAAYAGGDLSSDRVADLRVHLSKCAQCLALSEWLQGTEWSERNDQDDIAPEVEALRVPKPDLLHVDLISRLHREIVRRDRDGLQPSMIEAESIPSDDLVECVGRLAGSASRRLLAVCRAELWPRVRQALGVDSPGALSEGSYRPVLSTAMSLLHTDALDIAARASAPVLSFPAKKTGEMPADGSGLWTSSCLALLRTRLNAAWYLEGLDELWPFEGVSSARRLWHDGGLKDLDDYLRPRVDLLTPFAADLATSIVDLPVWVTRPWSGVLKDVLPAAIVAQAPVLCDALRARDSSVETLVLLRTLLRDELGDAADDAAIRPSITENGTVLEVESPDGGLVAVWFAPTRAAKLVFRYRSHMAFDAIIRARYVTCVSQEDESQGDEDEMRDVVRFARFDGVAKPSACALDFDGFLVPAAAFDGGHEKAVRELQRIIAALEA